VATKHVGGVETCGSKASLCAAVRRRRQRGFVATLAPKPGGGNPGGHIKLIQSISLSGRPILPPPRASGGTYLLPMATNIRRHDLDYYYNDPRGHYNRRRDLALGRIIHRQTNTIGPGGQLVCYGGEEIRPGLGGPAAAQHCS